MLTIVDGTSADLVYVADSSFAIAADFAGLNRAIDRAKLYAEQAAGWSMVKQQRTEQMSYPTTGLAYTLLHPVDTTATTELVWFSPDAQAGVTVDASSYTLDDNGLLAIGFDPTEPLAYGRVYRHSCPTRMDLTYTAGYDFTVDTDMVKRLKTALGGIVAYFDDPRFKGVSSVRTSTGKTTDTVSIAQSVALSALQAVPEIYLQPFKALRPEPRLIT